jgi:hypothetical protein
VKPRRDYRIPAKHGTESPATKQLTEEVCERENCKQALTEPRPTREAPGVDGMTVHELADFLKQHWPAIRERLLNGTHKPQAVKPGEIPSRTEGCESLTSRWWWFDSSSKWRCRFYKAGGTARFPITAMGFGPDAGGSGEVFRPSEPRPSDGEDGATELATSECWANSSISEAGVMEGGRVSA